MTEQLTEKNTEKITEKLTEQSTETIIQTERTVESTEMVTDKQTKELIETEISTDETDKICSNEEILEGKCMDGIIKSNQIDYIFNEFKNKVLTTDYKGEKKIVLTRNIGMQISILEDQKNTLDTRVSSVDLRECENILKTQYNIPEDKSLIVAKIDIKGSDVFSTRVKYEIYNPNDLTQLDLSYCGDIKIAINVPVNFDSNELENLFD